MREKKSSNRKLVGKGKHKHFSKRPLLDLMKSQQGGKSTGISTEKIIPANSYLIGRVILRITFCVCVFQHVFSYLQFILLTHWVLITTLVHMKISTLLIFYSNQNVHRSYKYNSWDADSSRYAACGSCRIKRYEIYIEILSKL